MRILTRTFPPSSNPNYGGILQAWALQQALGDLGHESYVDSTRSNRPHVLQRTLERAARATLAPFANAGLPVPGRGGLAKRIVDEPLLGFAHENIREVAVYIGGGQVDRQLVDSFDGYVVGSDQVWRPQYVDVASYLLDFLPPDNTKPRVAYAASFGRADDAEYSTDLRATTAPLAARFDQISTREQSGVTLAKTLWEVDAQQMPDPTLLLDRVRYEQLMPRRSGSGRVATYLLDSSSTRLDIAKAVGEAFEAPVHMLIPAEAPSMRKLRQEPQRYQKLSIGSWLEHLQSSAAVVTDSFHGMVFAIIFNRPFVVIPNEKRGRARFDDLLGSLGLQDQLVTTATAARHAVAREIDWSEVNTVLKHSRSRGINFLRESLEPTTIGDSQ